MLTGGQSAVAETGKAPVLRVVARPRDAVQWALYYPPVLYVRPDELPAGRVATNGSTIHASYLQGDIQKAFDDCESGTSATHAFWPIAPPYSWPWAGWTRPRPISSGRCSWPTTASPGAANNYRRGAERQRQSLRGGPEGGRGGSDSATALIALSYAQQARFNLEEARASLEKAVQLDPANALAWARLAELQASFGN